jgi:predicted nucleic acid-binding protein
MISCVDTNVILDVIANDPAFADSSLVLLARASEVGSLAIHELVYGELAPRFDSQERLDTTLAIMGIRIIEGGADVAYLAGKKWAAYRASGGSRQRMLPDFMIGAHALIRGDCLLTRDRGFYKSFFPELKALEG